MKESTSADAAERAGQPSSAVATAEFSLIVACRGCKSRHVDGPPVLAMDPMPLAGRFCRTLDEARHASVFPLTWVRCRSCGLVQVLEDVPDHVLFQHYSYSSSSVPGLVRHFEEYARFLEARYDPQTRLALLEIGCNDGVLLRRLPEQWDLVGVDPSDVACRAVEQDGGYTLANTAFTPAWVDDARLVGSIDVITGSNCLAHASDIQELFRAAHRALRPGGHFWIEVHDLASLLAGAQWDTVYHEHKAEWDVVSLRRCLALLGFKHVETHHRPLHGGLLRVCVEKVGNDEKPLESEVSPSAEGDIESGLASLRRAYERRYDTEAARDLRAAVDRGETIVAYGAAGRANVYLNQMRELPFQFVVDDSPLRANTFLPSVGTPVVPREELYRRPSACCLITAWNYRDDIIEQNRAYRGRWLTAFGP